MSNKSWAAQARDEARRYGATAMMPIRARIEQQTARALLLNTGFSRAWFPKRLVTKGEEGTFFVPHRMHVEPGRWHRAG